MALLLPQCLQTDWSVCNHIRVATSQTDKKSSLERLLEAAAKVFAERGYQAASVDETPPPPLSKGAVYWNFSSKDELFHALLEERIDPPDRGQLPRSCAAL